MEKLEIKDWDGDRLGCFALSSRSGEAVLVVTEGDDEVSVGLTVVDAIRLRDWLTAVIEGKS